MKVGTDPPLEIVLLLTLYAPCPVNLDKIPPIDEPILEPTGPPRNPPAIPPKPRNNSRPEGGGRLVLVDGFFFLAAVVLVTTTILGFLGPGFNSIPTRRGECNFDSIFAPAEAGDTEASRNGVVFAFKERDMA
jgi:hypothetical protein